jgi:hypothetical protein
MDSEHRHELKENDLEQALAHMGDLWRRYGTQALTLVVVGLAAFMGTRWLSGREQRNLEAAYGDLAAATNPAAKIQVAEDHSGLHAFQGKALLDAADLLSEQAIYGSGASAMGNAQMSASDAEQNLKQAAATYDKVIQLKQSPLQVIYARFNLAGVQESLGNWAGARVQYETIQKEAAEQWPHLAKLAVSLAGDLDSITQKIEFPAPPKETPAPAAALPPGHPTIVPLAPPLEGPTPLPVPAPAPTPPAAAPAPAPVPSPAPAPGASTAPPPAAK